MIQLKKSIGGSRCLDYLLKLDVMYLLPNYTKLLCNCTPLSTKNFQITPGTARSHELLILNLYIDQTFEHLNTKYGSVSLKLSSCITLALKL